MIGPEASASLTGKNVGTASTTAKINIRNLVFIGDPCFLKLNVQYEIDDSRQASQTEELAIYLLDYSSKFAQVKDIRPG
jgi:hypothetical protein